MTGVQCSYPVFSCSALHRITASRRRRRSGGGATSRVLQGTCSTGLAKHGWQRDRGPRLQGWPWIREDGAATDLCQRHWRAAQTISSAVGESKVFIHWPAFQSEPGPQRDRPGMDDPDGEHRDATVSRTWLVSHLATAAGLTHRSSRPAWPPARRLSQGFQYGPGPVSASASGTSVPPRATHEGNRWQFGCDRSGTIETVEVPPNGAGSLRIPCFGRGDPSRHG